MRSSFLFLLIIVVFTTVTTAQVRHKCGTDAYHQMLYQDDPSILDDHRVTDSLISEVQQLISSSKVQGTVRVIPVVFHVIHGNGAENISDAQIQSGISVLNADFRRLNSDTNLTRSIFKSVAADMEVEFRLAKKDPSGNCTNGIVRVYAPDATMHTQANDAALKNLSRWPTDKYLNIWVVKQIGDGSVLGYARFPSSSPTNMTYYGTVVASNQVGRTGNAVSNGRTLTHEIGHNFNLYHTFEGGCGVGCTSTGDRVCDTPPSSVDTYFCNSNQNTCNNDSPNQPDQIENYMSYDNCQNMYTKGQRDRAQAALTTITNLINLWSSANLVATGTNDGYIGPTCAPIVDFHLLNNDGCENVTTYSFVNNTYNINTTLPVSYRWEFEGGTPDTSNLRAPTNIVYNTPGTYKVKLTATAQGGTNSKTITGMVRVKETYKDGGFADDFSTSQFPKASISPAFAWEQINGTAAGWSWANTVATTNAGCIVLSNLNVPTGTVRQLITPPIDFTGNSNINISFRYAYSKRSTSSDVKLSIAYSVDCGKVWYPRFVFPDTQLVTAPTANVTFNPDTSQWKTLVLPINDLKISKAGLVRLEVTTNSSSNFLFIDDFRLFNPNSVNSGISNQVQVSVIPNPTNGDGVIRIQLENPELFDVEVFDLSGRKIEQKLSFRSENYTTDIALSRFGNGLKSGIYVLRLATSSGSSFTKFVVE